jgi:hypothetical protein
VSRWCCVTHPAWAWAKPATLGPKCRQTLLIESTWVPPAGLVCRRIRRYDMLGVVRLNNAILRLLSEPAAWACRQLERLHGVGNRCVACRRGEPDRRGNTTFMWAPVPMLWPLRVSPTLVGGGNFSCERVVGGGVFPYKRSCRRRGGKSSCEAETPHARQSLVGESSFWWETRRLASDDPDKGL